ncbi:MAG: carbohydrate binding family 9 domain-containing protein, partial [Bdellovibrionales bacterium]|nr:carbohydrate binding family 9 domain-containing protein [Bdellovibrionales bacterium]
MPLKKVILFQIKALFFLLFLSPSTLALAPASDTPYLKTSLTEDLEVIFSEDFKEEDFLIQNRAFRIFQEYGRQFPVEFYRKNSLIFFSATRRQTPLAITHTLPLPLIQIYPSPFQIMDQVSTNNWLTDSLVHEMTHMYQLNARSWFSYLLSYIMPSFFWPVYPNIYFHDLILEGHAVLIESVYGTGGRLFSGWERALAFSQLKNNLSFKRLMNNYDDPFSKGEKFTQGGYFFSYLMEKFPLSDINKIFSVNGRNLLWPLGLYTINRSFKKALGQDFDSLFNEYKEFYGAMALKQTSSPEPTLMKSQIPVPINSDEKNIYFGFTCFDSDISKMAANEMRRDGNLWDNDSVYVLLDTYNDHRSGFFFRVNPLGAMEDVAIMDSGDSRNENWDAVWDCRAKVNEDYWTAEIGIPFSQLRFSKSDT